MNASLSRRSWSGVVRVAIRLSLLLTAAPVALAREDVLSFHVEAGEDEACPRTHRFSEQLLRRTERVRPATSDEAALLFRIETRRDGATIVGRLAVHELAGAPTHRSVAGASCDEVISAMALIAAVLVDPNASAGDLPEPSVDSESDRAPAPKAGTPGASSVFAPGSLPPAPAPSERSRDRRARVAYGGGVALAFEGAVAPGGTPALALVLEATLERDAALSPLVAIALERGFPKHSETPSGVARFQWTALRATGCPVRLSATDRWALRPCALFEFGELAASGERTERRSAVDVPWLALGGALRAEASPFAPLVFVLDLGFLVPLRRDTFYFDPATPQNVAFAVPAIGAMLGLGIVTRLD